MWPTHPLTLRTTHTVARPIEQQFHHAWVGLRCTRERQPPRRGFRPAICFARNNIMRDYLRPFLPMFGSLLISCSLFAQLAPVSTGRMTYPLEAKAAGREGSVKLRAVIDERGR